MSKDGDKAIITTVVNPFIAFADTYKVSILSTGEGAKMPKKWPLTSGSLEPIMIG